ncbi:excalibur calcium-binding domain-containing protein [Dechloromonas denitrificans]|uniref:excalibur calcium-binding domain-containing protein n=1 Tax=Dechloromonas denitrificans TaxID=281362 RepID=UPI0023E42B81|nr:excalibur calcium-binding domain-containing protein [Dechloromonas denitrificans]
MEFRFLEAVSRHRGHRCQSVRSTSEPAALVGSAADAAPGRFQCDGRTHCSQMTSCAEATYFIRNCPNTQMDGDGDGNPCESQWCTGPFAK